MSPGRKAYGQRRSGSCEGVRWKPEVFLLLVGFAEVLTALAELLRVLVAV